MSMRVEKVKYIKFVEVSNEGKKTKRFNVVNLSEQKLGVILFNPRWRKYVFAPNEHTIFDSECLNDIIEFLNEETKKWRESTKNKGE